jgi:GNAT superfamily N-acetyltransferase
MTGPVDPAGPWGHERRSGRCPRGTGWLRQPPTQVRAGCHVKAPVTWESRCQGRQTRGHDSVHRRPVRHPCRSRGRPRRHSERRCCSLQPRPSRWQRWSTLCAGCPFLPELSLVATVDGVVVGHVLLTAAVVVDELAVHHRVLVLSPMSVLPEQQRRGIGAALVRRRLLVRTRRRRTGGPAGQPRLLPAVRVPGQPHARYRDGPSGLGSARSGHGMPAVDVSDSDSRGTPRVTALPGSCALKAGYRRPLRRSRSAHPVRVETATNDP